jgi:uncharacterized membrane protein
VGARIDKMTGITYRRSGKVEHTPRTVVVGKPEKLAARNWGRVAEWETRLIRVEHFAVEVVASLASVEELPDSSLERERPHSGEATVAEGRLY